MKKLAMCMLLAFAVSCGEDEGEEPKTPEPSPLSLTGEVESLRCDGSIALYTIRMRGNAKPSCKVSQDYAMCAGWPAEIIGEQVFEVRCDGDQTLGHYITCRDLRAPDTTTVVLYATEEQQQFASNGVGVCR